MNRAKKLVCVAVSLFLLLTFTNSFAKALSACQNLAKYWSVTPNQQNIKKIVFRTITTWSKLQPNVHRITGHITIGDRIYPLTKSQCVSQKGEIVVLFLSVDKFCLLSRAPMVTENAFTATVSLVTASKTCGESLPNSIIAHSEQ